LATGQKRVLRGQGDRSREAYTASTRAALIEPRNELVVRADAFQTAAGTTEPSRTPDGEAGPGSESGASVPGNHRNLGGLPASRAKKTA
jgi:hypothetical protein